MGDDGGASGLAPAARVRRTLLKKSPSIQERLGQLTDVEIERMHVLRVFSREGSHVLVLVPPTATTKDVLREARMRMHAIVEPGEPDWSLYAMRAGQAEKALSALDLPVQMRNGWLGGPQQPCTIGLEDNSRMFRFVATSFPTWCKAALKTGELNIGNKNLEELPEALVRIKNLRLLSLRQNKLTKLPDTFWRLQQLTKLILVKNRFEEFPKVLCQLTSLYELDMGNNKIKSIPPEISHLTKLTHLLLYVNELETIPDEVGDMKSLTALSLTYNRLTEMPKCICRLTGLEELRLASNSIKMLPDEIGELASLHFLDVRNNRLTFLPDTMGQLTHLRNLGIRQNMIVELPPSLTQIGNSFNAMDNEFEVLPADLGSCRLLSMRGNGLRKIPSELNLGNVTELILSENAFETLPASIGTMKSLVKVLLISNALVTIPPQIGMLTKLQDLHLQDNHIAYLPNEICLLPLAKLNLAINELTELPPDFWTITSLSVLNISINRLGSLPKGDVSKMVNLKELYLGGNRLIREDLELITEFPALRILALCYNEIESIPSTISKLSLLQTLFMSGNKLDGLPIELSEIKSLKELYLGNTGLTSVDGACLHTLEELNVLDLSCNHLGSLPASLGSLPALRDLLVSYNNIPQLPNEFGQLASTLCMLEVLGNPPTLWKCRGGAFDDGTPSGPSGVPPALHHLVGTYRSPGTDRPSGVSEMHGRRPHMEDAVTMVAPFRGRPEEAYYAVYDGHGGSRVAHYLAEHMHVTFAAALALQEQKAKVGAMELLPADESGEEEVGARLGPPLIGPVPTSFRLTFAQTCLMMQRRDLGKTQGATAAIVYIRDKRLYFANTGDARTVLCRSGNAIRCSYDHKPTLREEEQRIRELGGFVTDDGRVNGVLAVARSMGDFALSPFVSNDPYLMEMVMDDGNDEFIICACDGVWDVISDQRAVDIVRSEAHPGAGALKLKELAYSASSGDNISAVVIRLDA